MNERAWMMFAKITEKVAALSRGNLYMASWVPDAQCFEWTTIVGRCCQSYRLTEREAMSYDMPMMMVDVAERYAEMIAHYLDRAVRADIADRKDKNDTFMAAQKAKEQKFREADLLPEEETGDQGEDIPDASETDSRVPPAAPAPKPRPPNPWWDGVRDHLCNGAVTKRQQGLVGAISTAMKVKGLLPEEIPRFVEVYQQAHGQIGTALHCVMDRVDDVIARMRSNNGRTRTHRPDSRPGQATIAPAAAGQFREPLKAFPDQK